MKEEEFIITHTWGEAKENDPYPFWIYYDSEEHDERMKFLARMKPEKDIDWEKIQLDTAEYEIAKALCEYKEFQFEPRYK
jgi:hypothetical protein